jgi:MFS family permease
MMAVAMVVIADIVSPRERGKYMGIMGAVMAVAQIGGPLLGGVVTDAFGWRWNFFLPVPIAVVAIILIQTTLHLQRHPLAVRPKVDYFGAVLIAAGVGLLLVWISLAGHEFDWDSTTSVVLGIVSIVLVVAAVIWEFFAKSPIIPLRLFAQRTFALATVASISVGITMFGAAVFLSQYLQLARGMTPTESGVATIPMVIGSLAASMGIGSLVSRYGHWKRYVVGAAVVLLGGLVLMGTIHFDTEISLVWLYMFLLGLGTGGLMQNLVLVSQNSLPPTQLGAGTGALNFFRSLGGTVGIAVLGTLLAAGVKDRVVSGLQALVPTLTDPTCADSVTALQSGVVPAVDTLCDPVRVVIEGAYGDSIAGLFMLIVPIAVITLLCVIFLPNKPLSRKNAVQQIEEELGASFSALEPIDGETTGTEPVTIEAGGTEAPKDEDRRA